MTFDGLPEGGHCGSPTSRDIDVVNDCGEQLAIRYCLFSTRSGSWECGIDGTVSPGEGMPGAWTCESDGRFFYSAMPADEWTGGSGGCEFPRLPDE